LVAPLLTKPRARVRGCSSEKRHAVRFPKEAVNLMKKLLSLLFTAAIVFTLTAPAFAYNAAPQDTSETKATKEKKAKKTKAPKTKKAKSTEDTSKM